MVFAYGYLSVFDWTLIWIIDYSDIFKIGLVAVAATFGMVLIAVLTVSNVLLGKFHLASIAFATLVRERVGALAVADSGFLFFNREQVVALAAHHGMPVVYPWRDAAAAGGLMSYGASPF